MNFKRKKEVKGIQRKRQAKKIKSMLNRRYSRK